MSRILPKRSIIQTTLFNVTLSIFVFVITFVILFGQTFWEKESIKLNYQLLSRGFDVESKIQSQEDMILNLKDNDNLTKDQKIQKVNEAIAPLLNQNNAYSVAFYDIDLDWVVYEKDKFMFPVNDVLSTLNNDKAIQEMRLSTMTLVSVPVFQGGLLKGYVWAYASSSEFALGLFIRISIFSILTLGFLAITVFLIRKYIEQIQDYLKHFSESIIHPDRELDWDAEKLPELKPVLSTIASYTEALNHVNQELHASQRKITQIMEGISDGFFSVDKDWRFAFVNQEAEKFFNQSYKELLEKTIFEVVPEFRESIMHQKMQMALVKNEAIHWELEGDSSDRFYSCHVYPFDEGLTVFFRNITEFKQQQAEFDRLERLNLIGQLAAGISHEIRNPLTTVKGFLQLRGAKVKDPEDKEYYDLMISEIDRSNSIITDFLSLAKSNLDQAKPRDINEIIHKIYPMLQADAYYNNKEVVLELNALPILSLNENEIRQLLLNLVRNGLEVTPEHGCVIIRTYEEEGKVILAVKDQGDGIPEEVQEKIGTPFFTTKESGTGLGVAISFGIARRHKADLVFNTGSQGTTFKVIFTL